jgi:hypothetical protein
MLRLQTGNKIKRCKRQTMHALSPALVCFADSVLLLHAAAVLA